MFHNGQGVQYTSKVFYDLLRANNIVQLFSNTGRPHDNAVTEVFFSALKEEELYRINFKSEREFYECVDHYIAFYNTKRPHGTLAYKTPEQFEETYRGGKGGRAKLDKGFKSHVFWFFASCLRDFRIKETRHSVL